MTNLRPDMREAPAAMRSRPVDHRGFYVPWFVTDKDAEGRWDFTSIRSERKAQALRDRLDWVTGEPLGRHAAFCIGPMCIINRITAEPPVRLQTARWSAEVCPFMSRPLAKRPEQAPEGHVTPGIPVASNPGLVAIYSTPRYTVKDGLIRLGDPMLIDWWARGRRATPEEIQDGFDAGAEQLGASAAQEGETAI